MDKQAWFIRMMEYYYAVKRKELLIHLRTGMALKDVMLRERSRAQKSLCAMAPFTARSKTGQGRGHLGGRDRREPAGLVETLCLQLSKTVHWLTECSHPLTKKRGKDDPKKARTV